MRQYYKSDKKRREDTKKRKNEEKRAKRLNKSSKSTTQPEAEKATNAASVDPVQDSKIN